MTDWKATKRAQRRAERQQATLAYLTSFFVLCAALAALRTAF